MHMIISIIQTILALTIYDYKTITINYLNSHNLKCLNVGVLIL